MKMEEIKIMLKLAEFSKRVQNGKYIMEKEFEDLENRIEKLKE